MNSIITAKTTNQKNYIRGIVEADITFCTGPAGTGKTYIALGIACQKLLNKECGRIVLSRPLVCTGTNLGSFPGELDEKIAPYFLPFRDKLVDFLGLQRYNKLRSTSTIDYQPLELMRGATFDDAIMVLDEAQNCTYEQIKMFITRMGEGTKVIINGDEAQTDLRNRSGLSTCVNRLFNIEGVCTASLGFQDIQRNGILGRVLTALERED